jgi:hypothetical protein
MREDAGTKEYVSTSKEERDSELLSGSSLQQQLRDAQASHIEVLPWYYGSE